MTQLHIISPLTGIIGIAIFILALLTLWKLFKRWGERELLNSQKYEKLYLQIEGQIRTFKRTEANYDLIYGSILDLVKQPYKNREKTAVLYMELKRNFPEESAKHVLFECRRKIRQK